MMKAYPEYKESGVNWVGQIPVDWLCSKFGFVKTVLTDYTANGSFADLAKNVKYKDEKDFARLVRLTDLRKDLKNTNGVWVNEHSYKFLSKSSLFGGEFLLANVGAHAGLFYQMPDNIGLATLAPNMFMAKFNSELVTREFMAFVGQSIGVNSQLKLLASSSAAQPKLNKDDFKSVQFSYPSLEEQKLISNYLAIETSKINLLISEKQNFIKLLKEKRQALISHVVTKGLNPNVGMKDSGVEWIAEVPEHWDVTKLRYLGKCQNGINIDGDAFGSGYPFISYGDVYKNKALPSKVKGLVQSTAKDREVYSVESGDVLFTRTSETIDEIGFTSVCHNDMENAVFAGFLIRFRPKENAIDPLYSEYYFQNEKLRAFFVKEMNLVTRASLSQELLKRMPVTIPPVEEQKEIAEYIYNKDKLISELANEAKNSIELLKEHRTALISAAVTGKIDVREMA